MTRIGKVLLAVLVLMLTCFLVIGAGPSEVKAAFKEIKIKLHTNNGRIFDFCLVTGPNPQDCKEKEKVPGEPDLMLRQTILHYSGSNCIVMVIMGTPYQVCW